MAYLSVQQPRRSVLVIEAHPELRRYVAALLAKAGHCPHAFASLAEARVGAVGVTIEVVVTDLGATERERGSGPGGFARAFPGVEITTLADAPPSRGYLQLAAVLGARRALALPFMSAALAELTRPVPQAADRPLA